MYVHLALHKNSCLSWPYTNVALILGIALEALIEVNMKEMQRQIISLTSGHDPPRESIPWCAPPPPGKLIHGVLPLLH
jgi:hypothetical protein